MAETLVTLKTRRSCRAYKPELIPQEKLNAIIEAGTYAATGMGKQSPIIIAVTDRALRDKLSAMNAAINESAWDGAWYVRGFDDDGNPIGSSKNREGKIYLNTQSWAIVCGAATPERTRKILASIDRLLKTPLGYRLMAPAYRHFDPVIGRVTSMEPGICENGTIYTHCNAWMVWALLRAGLVERAWSLYRDATPAYGDSPLKASNPRFVYGNCFFGPEHRNAPYRMEFNWITGSVAWFFNIELDGFLGIRRDYDGIRVAPHLPRDWSGFTQTRTWRGRTFDVEVKGGGWTVARVSVDGKALPNTFVPEGLLRDGSRILVEMASPADAGKRRKGGAAGAAQ